MLLRDFAARPRELSRVSQVPFSCASFWQGLEFAVQKSCISITWTPSTLVRQLTLLLLQLLMVAGMVLSFAWATVALDITVTTVLRRRHMHARHSSHSCSSQHCQSCHRRRLAHRHLHCHRARRRHSQQQVSQRSRHQPAFGSSSKSSLKSWMVAAVLQLSPKRSLTLSLALSPRPEPHRHQRVCHQLELRRSYIGGRTAATASSAAAECYTHSLQHRT